MQRILVAFLVVLAVWCRAPIVRAQQASPDSSMNPWTSWKPYQRDTAGKHSKRVRRRLERRRITDSIVAQSGFMSPDRYWERYPQWTPYQYAACNPLRYTDPSGDTIVFAGADPKQTETQFNTAINYLRSGGVDMSQIDALRASSAIITIETIRDFDNNYESASRVVRWNPDRAMSTPDGSAISPATILLHELAGHAYLEVFHKTQYSRNTAQAYPVGAPYRDREEERVIEQIERPAASLLGEGLRYDSKPRPSFLVPDPASIVPVVPDPNPPVHHRPR